jgi:aminoglycoside 6'-N-acetyltransferase I
LPEVRVRQATPRDRDAVAQMCAALWPESTAQEHSRELEPILAGRAPGILPLVILVAESGAGEILGFVEAGLRSYADGCDPARPVGYLEGWYVSEGRRRQGVGAKLVAAAEDWARALGCVEMASDTWIDNEGSQRAHQALGYEVVDRCVTFRKTLSSPAAPGASRSDD